MDMTGSSSPSMPFGSLDSFQDGQEYSYQQPPVPAPGPALLDDTESTMLDHFFDAIGSSELEGNSYFLEGMDTDKNETHGPLRWRQELPPVFHGSTTSFAQPRYYHGPAIECGQGTSSDDSRSIKISNQGQEMASSAEVPATASTALQDGRLMQTYHTSSNPYATMARGIPDTHQNAHHRITSSNGSASDFSHVGLTSRESPTMPLQSMSSAMNRPEFSQDMYYRPSGNETLTPVPMPTAATNLSWGSDVNFFDHGFVAPPSAKTVEQVTNTLLHSMECLKPQTSTTTTTPSSPYLRGITQSDNMTNNSRSEAEPSSGKVEDSAYRTADEQGPGARSRKRRKESMKTESDGEQQPESFKSQKKNKVAASKKSEVSRRSSLDEYFSRREISQPGDQKPGRENLTTEQKRSNHILSEQKRRNVIKQGFDDVCELVPELNGGGFSKSAMLTQAADWLDKLVGFNDQLNAHIAKTEKGEL